MRHALIHFGGETIARRKMTDALRERLAWIAIAKLREMEESFRLKPDSLVDLAAGRCDDDAVDYWLFETVAPSVKLSIHEVLGDPQLTAEDQVYWKNEMELSPLHMLGAAHGEAYDRSRLGMVGYVISRAIEELNSKGSIHSVLGT